MSGVCFGPRRLLLIGVLIFKYNSLLKCYAAARQAWCSSWFALSTKNKFRAK